MDRREFLELICAAGASTVLPACSGAPLQSLYAYLTPPDDIVPGTPSYYATVCRACPAGCGAVVKAREARPIKLEGNPAHPISGGALCGRGQAFIQSLYSPHRVRTPMVRRGAALVPTTWEAALSEVSNRLQKARSVALLTGLERGSLSDVYRDFLAAWPMGEHVTFEPVSFAAWRAASRLVYAIDEVPFVSLEAADFVLCLGADLLDAWLSPVSLARQWAAGHQFGPEGRRLRLEYLGPRRNLTATAADHFTLLPLAAITEVAIGVLRRVHQARRASLGAEEAALVAAMVGKLAPGERRTEPHAAEIDRLAERLLRSRDPLVLFGGTEVLGPDATLVHAAVLLTNHLLKAVGKHLHYGRAYAYSAIDPPATTIDLLGRAGNQAVDALIVHGANPVYSLPGALEASQKLAKAKFVVALSSEHDETTETAQVVLPIHQALESWGDYEVTSDIVGLLQPVRMPLYNSRPVGDLLLDLGRRVGQSYPHADFKSYVATRFARRNLHDLGLALTVGGDFKAPAATPPPALSSALDTWPVLGQVAAVEPLTLLVLLSANFHDGRQSRSAWLLETPDSLTQSTWEVPVELSGDVAQAHGVSTGDRVRVSGKGRELIATAFVGEDLAPGTIAMRLGGGRQGAVESWPGANVMSVLAAAVDSASGELALSGQGVALERLGEGTYATMSGGTDSAERFLCLSMEESDARAGRYPRLTRRGNLSPEHLASHEQHAEHDPHDAPLPMPDDDQDGVRPADNVQPLPVHPEHRWGMVVDLDRCTGCGACVVACYAENNIAVVGREQVMLGRHQAWLRIEKHVFTGSTGREVRFLPVMCQQCAQAPCETVCPVFASHHTADGLNAQIYNRCIGTRYCANNCPYKVRRFNYFDWPHPAPGNQQLNPDVTVRTRGVMEKCTFCIQRIRLATNRAKLEERALKDGEVLPACVQTCPTGALSFGDFKQRNWRMPTLARDGRGYRLLDYQINTRPSVVYLRKLRPSSGG